MTTDLIPTCDLCDRFKGDTSGDFRVLPPVFREFGGRAAFSGTAVTVKCFEDNTSVKALLEGPGEGRVLVVDGAGSLRRALVGGNIGAAAASAIAGTIGTALGGAALGRFARGLLGGLLR